MPYVPPNFAPQGPRAAFGDKPSPGVLQAIQDELTPAPPRPASTAKPAKRSKLAKTLLPTVDIANWKVDPRRIAESLL